MAEDKNHEKDVWKTVYTADDLDGGSCTFLSLPDTLEFIKLNIEALPKEDLLEEEFEIKIRIHQMTEQQIAAMPEYQP